jgi:hypothetical protein
MRRGNRLAMAVWILASACGGDPDEARAAEVFAEFQDALQRGDASACRELLTRESRVAVDQMPWERVRGKRPLLVEGVERTSCDFRVHVTDPNDGDRPAEFVVVREYGKLVVDLVATAGMHTEFVEAAAGSEHEFEPRELTPADMDRIRLHELSQPPR